MIASKNILLGGNALDLKSLQLLMICQRCLQFGDDRLCTEKQFSEAVEYQLLCVLLSPSLTSPKVFFILPESSVTISLKRILLPPCPQPHLAQTPRAEPRAGLSHQPHLSPSRSCWLAPCPFSPSSCSQSHGETGGPSLYHNSAGRLQQFHPFPPQSLHFPIFG